MDSSAKTFDSVLISLVVCRNGDKFVCTDESRGWYLPAGRVDFGETFATAAKREAQEEAGLNVNLDGVYRIEYSPQGNMCRMRIVFAGTPVDPKAPLKSVSDSETNGASWLTVKEFSEKKPLRSVEVVSLFAWAFTARVFPMSILTGEDGSEINSSNVVTRLSYGTQILVQRPCKPDDKISKLSSPEYEYFLVSSSNTSDGEWVLPLGFMQKLTTFSKFVPEFMSQRHGLSIDMTGLIRLEHKAPPLRKSSGYVLLTYAATLKGDCKQTSSSRWVSWLELTTRHPQVVTALGISSPDVSADTDSKQPSTKPSSSPPVVSISKKPADTISPTSFPIQIYPLNLITFEGADYEKI